MFPSISSGLTLGKVISGISRTLQIAGQIIPIYEQAKPMVQNVRKAFSILKEINTNSSKSNSSNVSTLKSPRSVSKPASITSNSNNPTFFQ